MFYRFFAFSLSLLKNRIVKRIIEIRVPTGRYHKVAMLMPSPNLYIHGFLLQRAYSHVIHDRPNSINNGPNEKTSMFRLSNRSAQGPGFSGPMYLPLMSTYMPSISINPPFKPPSIVKMTFISANRACKLSER